MELPKNNAKVNNLKQAVYNNVEAKVQETLNLLSRGDKEVEIREEYKDVVLIFGNTGSGKSTFTQWLAGDSSKLIATEVTKDSGEFIIADGNNRIGNSTIVSKTIYPELIVDTVTNTAYYDCPGFSDTRSTSHDIVITYFNKKVADWAKRVKIIFIINHPSLMKGVDRQDFMTLLRHATDMVKDLSHFRNSIAIIATKVDNRYVRKGKTMVLTSDEIVVRSIADFLKEVKQDLEQKNKLPNISIVEKKFQSNAIKFIDVLLVKSSDEYTNIAIFRRPDTSGPISYIDFLNCEKKYVGELIHAKLTFTEKYQGDFGYTISEKSKNHINDLTEEINKLIWSNASDIAGKVDAHFHDLVEKVRDKIKSFKSSTFVDAHQEEAKAFSSGLNNGYNATLNMFQMTTNLTNPVKIAENINQTVTRLHINVPEGAISNILYKGGYLNFLEMVTNKKLNWSPWPELFKGTMTYLEDSRKNIQDDIDRASGIIGKRIALSLSDTAKDFQKHYTKEIKSLDFDEQLIVLNNAKYAMFNMVEEIKKKNKTVTGLLRTIQNVTNIQGIAISKDKLQNILNEINYISFLEILTLKELNFQSFEWVLPFNGVVENLSELEVWYKYLKNLYAKFSEYKIQRDKVHYVSDFENWGKLGNGKSFEVTKYTFELFLNKTSMYDVKDHKHIYNITDSSLQLEELNNVLNITLKRRLDKSCSGTGELAIKGDYVVVSHFIGTNGKINLDSGCGKLTAINIFALNRVFIDRNITLPGIKISIISPKWEIIGNRTIDLSGTNGERYYEVLAPGEDGEPGKPGKPGGTFFGIGDKFVNGEKLTILTDGGDGGSGQNGGDGRRGQDGIIPKISFNEYVPCRGKCLFTGGTYDCFYLNLATLRHECLTIKYGTSGEKGGNGGNSGRGGKGGFPGSITIIELGGRSGILKYSNKGRDGKPGIAGTGGVGGFNGGYIVVKHQVVNWIFWLFDSSIQKGETSVSRQPSGRNGILGATDINLQDPKVAAVIEQPRVINDFKDYLQKNLNDRYKKKILLTFLDQINTDIKVKRHTRAVPQEEDTYYLTNSATPGFSSPINYYCNLFKKSILTMSLYLEPVIKQMVTVTNTNLDDYNMNNNFWKTVETLTKIPEIIIEVGKQSRDGQLEQHCPFVEVLKANGENSIEHLSEEQLPEAKNRRKPEILLHSSKHNSNTFENVSRGSRVASNSSKFISSTCSGDFSNSSSHLTSDCSDYITKLKDTNAENHLGICHECSGRALETGVTVVDMNSNLTFGQLIVHKIFGTTKSLRKIHYMSPEQEYQLKLSELESQIIPVLENDPFMNGSDNCTSNWNDQS